MNEYGGRRRFLKNAAMLGVLGGAGAALGPDGGLLLNSVEGAEQLAASDPGVPAVQFGLVTDTHYATIPDTNRPRFFKSSLPNVRQLVSELDRLPIDFSVHLGDVIQETHNREQTLALMSALDAEFRKSKSPIHYVIGNHDLGDNSKQDFLEHTSGQVKKTRYHFDLRGYRFIILDTSFTSNGVEYDSGNFSWTDSSVPSAEMQWLDEILDDARDEGLRAVVFSHQNFGRASRGHRIRNADAVLSLFESKGNVSAIFNGHLHPGGYEFLNGIHIVTTVATVNGPDRAGCHVVIHENGTIEVKGIGTRQPDWGPLLPG